MKKRIFTFCLVLVVLLAGCSGTNSSVDDEITIGVLVKSGSDKFIKVLSDAIVVEAQKQSVKLIVADADSDVARQIQQADDMISQKVNGIILIAVKADKSAPIVDKAIAAKIPIVVCNSTTKNASEVFFVGSDVGVEEGKLQAEYIKLKKPSGAKVVQILGSPADHPSRVGRSKGIQDYLLNDPNFESLAEETANWDPNEAKTLVTGWLTQYSNQIDVIICQNDDMALGAAEVVIAESLKNQIMIIGVDATPDALQAIQDGKMDATVLQDAAGQGTRSLTEALEMIKAGKQKTGKVMIPFKLVTKDNVDLFL